MSTTGKVAARSRVPGLGLPQPLLPSLRPRAASAQCLARISAREVLLDSVRVLVERAVSTIFDGHAQVPDSLSDAVSASSMRHER